MPIFKRTDIGKSRLKNKKCGCRDLNPSYKLGKLK